MVEARKRHCWECLRRRLVCGFEVPGCERCAASGVDCPGYGETPPMRVKWLVPGTVKLRQRKDVSNRQKNSRAGSESTGSEKSPSESSGANSCLADDTRKVALPHPHLKTDYHALIDSVEYFNSCIYPQLANVLRLGTNANIYKLPLAMIQMGLTRPGHLQLGLVCLTLSHRMNQMGHDHDSKALRTTFFRYRGLMIRSLNDDINLPNKRNGGIVLAGILTLLLADAQEGISHHWRYHIEGVRRLIISRGGMNRVVTTPGALPIVLSFVHLVVLSDTSSPGSDMLVERLDLEEVYLMVKCYGENGYGFQMCPSPLFAEIVKINHIRNQMSKLNGTDENDLHSDAREVLHRIYGFSPAAWIESNESLTDASKLIMDTYQSAVALYCMSSLQSAGALPPNPFLKKNCDMERRILHGLIEQSLAGRCHGYMLWPLLVLGVQAVNGGPSLRAFVREKMVSMSAACGTYAPLAAKRILENFWDSGKDKWDDCFDKPYMFTTVLSVNRGQLPRRTS